jgi:hypothetical protein
MDATLAKAVDGWNQADGMKREDAYEVLYAYMDGWSKIFK